MADLTARFRLDISGIDAALTRVAAATLAVQGAFASVNAALAPFAGAFSAIKESLDLGGRLSDVSAQTDIAVGDLVVLRQAFANAGLSAEQVGPMINRLQKALAGADEEGNSTSEAFVKLGLSMQEIAGLSPAEQFARVSSALSTVADPAQRAAIAMQLFGRKGGEMMVLFRDGTAMQTAAQQVGGLAAVMDENAVRFDMISDALGSANLKGQQLAAGFTAAVAPALEEVGAALNELDLTGLGQMLGSMAVSAISVGQALSGMIPQIAGVVVAFALFRSGFDAKVVGAFSSLAPKATLAFAQVRAAMATMNFSSLATGARVAFTSIAASARAAALAIKGALISTGIGALVVALGMAIEALIGKFNRAKDAAKALQQIGNETGTSITSIGNAIRDVSSESDRIDVGKRIEEELQNAREAIANVERDFEHLDESQRGEIVKEYETRIKYLNKMREILGRIPPEVMAHRQAEKERAAALEESRKKAEQLRAELGKMKEGLDVKIEEARFGNLTPVAQREEVLTRVGAPDTAAIDAELALLAAKRKTSVLTNQGVERMGALIQARESLIGIEQKIADERERALSGIDRDLSARDNEGRTNEEKQKEVLSSTGARDRNQLETQINQLAARRNELSNEELAKLQALLEARQKLVGIEQEISNERQKQLEIEQRRAEFEKETAREIARLTAMANGDQETVRTIDREQEIEAETQRGISAGLSEPQARAAAEQKVQARENAAAAEKEREAQATREALDLEMRLAEAKAAGNKEEVRRLQWLQRYHAELERLRGTLGEEEAQEAARRLANAQDAIDNPVQVGDPNAQDANSQPAGPLYASSLARIGAGGNFVSTGTDPILNENRRQTSLLAQIARSLNRGNQNQPAQTEAVLA